MPRHYFGIMQIDPKNGKSYDYSEPQKYNCISVDDDYILPILKKFKEVKCYWHTLDRPEMGLMYYSVTLIPPESLDAMMKIIWSDHHLSELLTLFSNAERQNKFVIHFGI